MVNVSLMPDTLDEATRGYAPASLAQPVFINSVPKSGTHLLRNILRMFVPVEQHYSDQFIQWPNMQEHLAAFDRKAPRLSWGHLLFSDASAIETAHCRRLLLVRDPYDWVLSRARFFISDQFSGNLDFLKDGSLRSEDLLNLMIFGIYGKAPTLAEQYQFNAAGWIGTGALLVRYEELAGHAAALDSPQAEVWFTALLSHCGIDMPANWRDRVTTGADRKQSGTARENLSLAAITIPEELPEVQKRLVDFASPGLRALLGYA